MSSLNAKENTVENYKRLITSSKAYIKYLESLGENNRIQEECDIDSLKVGYATFALLLWKDEYIRKDEAKNLSTILVDKMLEIYIGNIAKKNKDGKWQLGEIVFDSNLDVVDKVRNKLAHGDFIIDNHQIHFDINGQEGSLPIDSLVAFSVHLGNDWEKMKQYGENYRDVFRNSNIVNGVNIKTREDLEKAIDNISYIEIKDKPKILFARTLEYLQMAYFLKDKVMKEVQRGHSVENIPEQPNAKKLLESVGMNAKVTEIPARELPNIDKVIEMYLSKMPHLIMADPYFQQKYLTHWIHESVRKEMAKKNICHGLLSNQIYLQELEQNPNRNLIDIIQHSKYGETVSITNEKAIIASYIASFYFTYIYGLDAVLNIVNREYLPDIVEGKTFDFSNLDLSAISPKSIQIEHEYPEFQEQIDKLKSDVISFNEKYDKVLKNYNVVKNLPGKEILTEELKSLLEEINRERERIIELIQKCELFMRTRYESYKWNRSIIEHIRNSIAHGNVFLDIFRGDYTTASASILFQDIHQDTKSFELELSAKEFNSLTNEENIRVLMKFLGEEEPSIRDEYRTLQTR